MHLEFRVLRASLLAATLSVAITQAAFADSTRIERGAYLVAIANCASCHAQDRGGQLTGAEIGYRVGNLGIFYPPNLTPDPETGLGRWSEQDIVTALHTGFRPDGRQLAPIMPWRAYAHLTQDDALAIAAYLRSLPPVVHAVPPPGTGQSATHPYHDLVTPKPQP